MTKSASADLAARPRAAIRDIVRPVAPVIAHMDGTAFHCSGRASSCPSRGIPPPQRLDARLAGPIIDGLREDDRCDSCRATHELDVP